MEAKTTNQRLQELLPQLFKQERTLGERYLLFELTSELTAAISLNQVWEVMTLPARAITPIPLMPSWIIGWSNGRDRVFSILSLSELLGLAEDRKLPQEHRVIVVQTSPKERSELTQQSLLLGITVNAILRTVSISGEEIVSLFDEFPSPLTPYLSGCIYREDQQIAILDLSRIIQEITSNHQLK
mgnify:CR=1 FL=1